jgi:hypothetical protein
MATILANAVQLPTSLLAEARRYAEAESRPVDDLIEEAVRLYLEVDPKLNALRRRMRQETLDAATASGLSPEEYIRKIIQDDRAEQRNAA